MEQKIYKFQTSPQMSSATLQLSTSNNLRAGSKKCIYSSTSMKSKYSKKRKQNKVQFSSERSSNKHNSQTNHKLSNQKQLKQQQQFKIYKNIKIVAKVATFLNNIKQKANIYRVNIGEKQISYLQNQDQNCSRDSYLIDFENIYLTYYSMLFLFIIILTIWTNTYQIVLGKQQQFFQIKIVSLILYIIWIILKLNSQWKTQQLTIISDRKKIILSYLKNDFAFQLSAGIALVFQIIQIEVLFYPERLLLMASIITYQKLMENIFNFYTNSQQIEKIMIILKLIMRILIFLHFLALFLLLIGQIQQQNGIIKTWITQQNLEDSSSFEKYITGYYWAATTMSTVGYGQITPTNAYERAVLAFVQIFCCLFFGYCVNIIGNTIGLIGQSSQKYLKQSRRLNRYLKTLQISNDTKNEIKQYLYNKYKIKQSYDQQNEKQMLSWMNQNIKHKIDKENNSKIIQNSKYLKKFSLQTKQRLAELMKKKLYAPNEILFNQNSGQIKLFLVNTGIVKQFSKFSQKLKKSIAEYNNKDNTIGYQKLLTGNKYNSITKANNYVLVYEIDRQQFLKAIKKNHQDFMIMNEVRQKVLQKKDKQKLQCYICQRLTHNVLYCPKIHFIPRLLQILLKQKEKSYQYNTRSHHFTRTQNRQQISYYSQQKDQSNTNKQIKLNVAESIKAIKNEQINLKLVTSKREFGKSVKSMKWLQNDFSKIKLSQYESQLGLIQERYGNFQRQSLSRDNQYNNKLADIQQFDKVIIDENQRFFKHFQIKNILKKINQNINKVQQIELKQQIDLKQKIKGFFALRKLRPNKTPNSKSSLFSIQSSKLEKNIQIEDEINLQQI